MSNVKIRNWLEVIGIFGVIASLIFVGLQMRQSQKIAMSSVNLQRTDTVVQMLSDMATDPTWRSVWHKRISDDFDSWTADESASYLFFSLAQAYRYQDSYWQYNQGFTTEDRWRIERAALKLSLTESPPFRALMEDSYFWTDAFNLEVEKILAEIESTERPQ